MLQGLLFISFIAAIGFVLVLIFMGRNKDEVVEVFEEVRSPVIMQVLVPRENDKTPLAAEQMFASIHGILRDAKKSLDLISFEIVSSGNNGIRFYVVSPKHIAKFVEGQIYAQYPNADISFIQDYALEPIPATYANGEKYQAYVTTGEIELDKDFIFPIKTFRSFEVDPLAAITGAMSDLSDGQSIWLQMLVRPISNYWQDASKDYITAIKEGRDPEKKSLWKQFLSDMGNAISNINLNASAEDAKKAKEVVKLAPGQDAELAQIEEKMLKPGFELAIRVVTKAGDEFSSEQLLRDVVASFKQFTTSHLNGFVHAKKDFSGEEVYNDYLRRYLPAEPLDIVNIEELASIFHLPNNSVETPNINWSRARKAEPPLDLPILGVVDDITVFGETDYREEKFLFGVKRADRRRHMYLLGKTGVGKSSTFKNMIVSDILKGDGVCYIDPHGQDIDEILDYIPPQRINDVVYFDPSDINNPIGFNMLELDDLSQRDLITDGVVSVFKKQFGESWGPRLQYLLQNAIATCIEAQNTTILAVQRILIDSNFRKFILKQVKDPILLKFWEDEFSKMSENSRLITEAIAPIQNKVGRFISSAVIRNIVGQVKSTINIEDIMNNKKILLINLAQGKIGEESASLLGGMIITRLQSAAMRRVDIPEEQREDFFLYVDEFQNFATDSFAKILSEARKFRLNLVMTNQYIEQIPLTVRYAIFGNVGTLASFVVSQSDASILANEFTPEFDAEDLVALESHAMYLKLCIDGMTSKPFSAKSLNHKTRLEKFNNREKVINASRERYGTSRELIEDKIQRWANQTYSEKGNRSLLQRDEVERQSENRTHKPYKEYNNDRRKEYDQPSNKPSQLSKSPQQIKSNEQSNATVSRQSSPQEIIDNKANNNNDDHTNGVQSIVLPNMKIVLNNDDNNGQQNNHEDN